MRIKGDVSFEVTTKYWGNSLPSFERGNMSVAEQVILLHLFVFALS